nr:MAG TPA: hypothetical protein [Bacteriophage sp.]
MLVKIKITTPRKVETPCGVFFALWGIFAPGGGFLGAFFGAFSRKSPTKKWVFSRLSGILGGMGSYFFKYIRMYNNINI